MLFVKVVSKGKQKFSMRRGIQGIRKKNDGGGNLAKEGGGGVLGVGGNLTEGNFREGKMGTS